MQGKHVYVFFLFLVDIKIIFAADVRLATTGVSHSNAVIWDIVLPFPTAPLSMCAREVLYR